MKMGSGLGRKQRARRRDEVDMRRDLRWELGCTASSSH